MLGILLLYPFGQNQKLKFIFVMIIYPTVFNIIQIWIFDNILKKSETTPTETTIPINNIEEKENKLSSNIEIDSLLSENKRLIKNYNNKEDNNDNHNVNVKNNDGNKNKIELNDEKCPILIKDIECDNEKENEKKFGNRKKY